MLVFPGRDLDAAAQIALSRRLGPLEETRAGAAGWRTRTCVRPHPASYSAEGVTGALQRTPGVTTGVWQMRPESRGHVRARSPDPAAAPAIQPDCLSAPGGRAAVAGLHRARRLMVTGPLAPFRGAEASPGPAAEDDAALLAHARSRGSTVYHAVGTCRMGTDALAVVDPRLRPRGMADLRVVDASVTPTMVSANTNAATMMTAERAAAMVVADRRAAAAAA